MTTPVAGLPVGNISVSGPDITVSHLLKNPRLLERRLGEATALEYFADKLLPNIGGAESGVVILEKWKPEFAVLDRKAEEIAADAEVPLAGSVEGDLEMVEAKTNGLGYVVTDKQQRRNQVFVVKRKERGLANNIALKFNGIAVALVKARIAAASRTMAVPDWSALVTEGSTPDPKAEWPHSTLELVKAEQREARIPWIYDGMLIHALDYWRLTTIYQLDSATSLATKLGLPAGIVVDNTGDVERGKPILFSSGNVGGTAWEKPIQTEVIPERRRERTVVQSTGAAAYFVDNDYGLLQLTGVADADLA
jgi:hypothetical protein